jgi:hypothetical protein
VNNHYSCHYNNRKMDGHTFSMSGDCVDHSGIPAKIAVQGVYTQTSFTMNGRIRIMIGGLPIPVSAATDAHRISAECPPPGTQDQPPPAAGDSSAAAPDSTAAPAQ